MFPYAEPELLSRTCGVLMEPEKKRDQVSILGLSTAELAGLSEAELTDNPTAIRMLLHYYGQLVDENNTLKNDNNTLRTYVTAYERQKGNSATGAVLLALSNISIGFGVNLLTADVLWPGVASLGSGIAMMIGGFFFSFFKRGS
jgi:hypothetical protein